MEQLRYPVGRFAYAGPYSPERRAANVDEIAALPDRLRVAVEDLSPAQLDTVYRPDGWTVRQVVHHVADSHMHAYLRMKFALAEDCARIVSYPEQLWAELPDSRRGPVSLSLALIDALHARWAHMLRPLGEEEYLRMYDHPENGRVTIDKAVAIYAWHGRHHLAHIVGLRGRMGW